MNNLIDYFDKLYKENKLFHSFLIGNTLFCDIKNDLNIIINNYIFNNINIPIDDNVDVYILETNDSFISKDSIKEVIKNVSTTSQFNNNKVYIIDKCERLNDYACNTLLKTLEEPKDNIYAFLITNNIDSVKPTISSRCQKIFISSEIKKKDFDEEVVKIGDKLINYIEEEKIDTIGLHPNIYNEIEDRNFFSNVLKYILERYFDALNNDIYDNNKNIINENNDLETISKKIIIIDENINRLDSYLNKNISIDRFIIEMWRC